MKKIVEKSFLYEFFGLPLNRKSITMENGQEIELGKIYSGTGFGSISEEHCEECGDYEDAGDYDEYDVENEYDYDDFISFMKTKQREREAYNHLNKEYTKLLVVSKDLQKKYNDEYTAHENTKVKLADMTDKKNKWVLWLAILCVVLLLLNYIQLKRR